MIAWGPDDDRRTTTREPADATRFALAVALMLWCAALVLLAGQILWGVWS